MDLKGFREAQSPWFFSQPPTRLVEINLQNKTAPRKDTQPTPDARFSGWAAPMEDGRLVTDYRSKCEVNFPTGTQFATRQFMQRNADEIMKASRKRQASAAGAGLSFDSRTDVPAQMFVRCSTDSCYYTQNVSEGVGVERIEGSSPPLFGTFSISRASWMTPAQPTLTTKFEGGRNSLRSSAV